MAMVELLIGPFIEVLLEQLASQDLQNFVGRYVGLRNKLKKWEYKLQKIQAVLDDADEKQNKRLVTKWLDDLRDVAYDMEDILEEFATEALICRLRGEHQASTSKLQNLIPVRCLSLTLRAVTTNIRLGSETYKITNRFNDIVREKDELHLRENPGKTKTREPRTSVEIEYCVYGRDIDRESIVIKLQSTEYNKDDDTEICVIPIHGMGGIGKTTLANFVLNDKRVQSHFEVKVWAHVSETFEVTELTKRILASVIRETRNREQFTQGSDNLESLQVDLREQLCGKKFLVILDDVWIRDYEKWNQLRAPFGRGAPESRIIITTRDLEVSSMMGTVQAHHLQVLSDDDCFSIFTQHALGARDFSAAPNLEVTGDKISKKCKGLPLAAITFAGLLRSNEKRDEWDERKWKEISNWRILDEPEVRDKIILDLMWSYHDLLAPLKRCFGYCSIFPKDYEFEEKQLILLWMAEGLIQPQEANNQMEDLGRKYFQKLVKKSFFQKTSQDGSRYRMHDFINDLALWVARRTCFRMDDRFEDSNKQKNLQKARHLSYLCGHSTCRNNFEALSELTRLRTFLLLVLPNQPNQERHPLTCNVSLQLLLKLGCLRVLSLSGYHITEVPKAIGDLKYLRYLDLSNTSIESVPKSTSNLYNLQTLILENCRALKKLPSNFWKLVNLRHLNIQETCSLEGMPPQMDKLTCLQTLSDFIVRKGPCSGLRELGALLHLRETVCISRLENVIQPGDARDANLIRKTNLGGLLFEWSCNLGDPQDTTIYLEVLNELQPHKDLKELTIRNYDGTELPIWLKPPSFPNMVLLRLENCKKCTTLPPVGQLSSLKVLSIIGMAGVQKVGLEFYEGGCSRPFGSLETLCFKDMEKWDNWSPCREFPRLRRLSIQNCPKLLGKLPDHLPLLEKHEINECPLLQDRPVTRVVQDIPQAESSM